MMKWLGLSAAAFVLAGASPAFAQMDCEREARVVINKLHPTVTADPMAVDDPMAIRVTNYTTLGYVACKTGEHEIARKHFERAQKHLGRMQGERAG